MPCPNCQDLHLTPQVTKIDPAALMIFWTDLISTADLGCPSCTLLLKGIKSFVPATELENIKNVELHLYTESEPQARLRPGRRSAPMVVVQFWEVHNLTIRLEFYTDDALISKRWPFIPMIPHVSTDSSIESKLAQASIWLRECTTKHNPRCAPAGVSKLPTRVIAVGTTTSNPYLYKTSLNEKAPYAALSYCWGRTRAFTTTQATYPARTAGFALSDLPKTCADAVKVARGLGIRFIWIDSLCIVQDDDEDWEREAAQMCSVYENALVTFAGLDSPDSETGLFVASSDPLTQKFDVELPVDKGSEGEETRTAAVYVRKHFDHPSTAYTQAQLGVPYSKGRLDYGVLDTRGWCLQELTLSPRLLWFSKWEMAWGCSCATACECEPDMAEGMVKEAGKLSALPDTADEIDEGATKECLRVWDNIVHDFTSRKLSFMKDRLPAIAGLAAAMQRRLKSTYLCGMWEADLDRQLLWQMAIAEYVENLANKKVNRDSVVEGYAPSWTWASVAGSITTFQRHYDPSRFRSLWEIVNIQFTPRGQNRFAPADGSLEVQSLVLTLGLVGGGFVYSPFMLLPSPPVSFCESSRFHPDRRPSYHGLESLTGKSLLCAIAGCMTDDQDESPEMPSLILGLVLEEVIGTPNYKRIGLIEISVVVDTKELKATWANCVERGETKRITIV